MDRAELIHSQLMVMTFKGYIQLVIQAQLCYLNFTLGFILKHILFLNLESIICLFWELMKANAVRLLKSHSVMQFVPLQWLIRQVKEEIRESISSSVSQQTSDKIERVQQFGQSRQNNKSALSHTISKIQESNIYCLNQKTMLIKNCQARNSV